MKKPRYAKDKLVPAKRPAGVRGKKAKATPTSSQDIEEEEEVEGEAGEHEVEEEAEEQEEEVEEGAEEQQEEVEEGAEEQQEEVEEEAGEHEVEEEAEEQEEEVEEGAEEQQEEVEGEAEEQQEEVEEEAEEQQEEVEEQNLSEPQDSLKTNEAKKGKNIFRAPSAVIKKRQGILRQARIQRQSNYVEFFISEIEETRRRQEKIAQDLRDLKEIMLKKFDELEQRMMKSHSKPNVSEIQKAEKRARLPWKSMQDMRYALKYHQKAIRTFICGTISSKHTKWETAVAKALMTKELLARQIYSGPSSRSVGGEIHIKMGVQCFKQPSALAAFMILMIRDNEAIKNKEFSLKKWRRVFELTLKNLRYQEIYRLASAAIRDSEEIQGQVAGILILNDLIQNAGEVTEPAPDMTSEEEMASWLGRHKNQVISVAIKVSGMDETNESPTILDLIKKNLRRDLTIDGMLKNNEKLSAGKSLEIEDGEQTESDRKSSGSDSDSDLDSD